MPAPALEFLKEAIRELAREAGYALAGFSPVALQAQDAGNLQEFTAAGLYGSMDWFARTLDMRLDPVKLHPAAKSALVLGSVYRTKAYDDVLKKSTRRIARYAAGKDYHRTLRKKGQRLLRRIQERFPAVSGRVVVDSAPVPEKILAKYAGIGFQGKNTNVIHPKIGSYFFISVILLNKELESDEPIADQCKTCSRCIDACPTQALEPYRIDPRKCISYWTIESRDELPQSIKTNLRSWVFGCDICQEVCPFNMGTIALRTEATDPAFQPHPLVVHTILRDHPPTELEWARLKTGSALGRTAFRHFRTQWDSTIP